MKYPEMLWVKCRCSLIFKLSERVDQAESDQYDRTYFEGQDDSGKQYNRRTRRRIAKSCTQIRDTLEHVEPGPLLDIGCSMGYTLKAAKLLGLSASGMDISPHAVDVCRKMGFPAEQGTLEAIPFPPNSFKILVLKHVFEHTPTPAKALEQLSHILQPNGAMFIAVPHADYRSAAKDPGSSRFYKPEAGGGEHFIYYTPETLTRMLQDNGFKTVQVHRKLFHQKANFGRKCLELALFLPLLVKTFLFDRLSINKEFWLIAIKEKV